MNKINFFLNDLDKGYKSDQKIKIFTKIGTQC